MRKAYIINKEVMLVESDEPESVELKVRDFTVVLTKKEYSNLCGCQYGIDYKAAEGGE